jgi:hypothetical protein
MPKSLTPKSTPKPKPAPTAPVAILQTEITKIIEALKKSDLETRIELKLSVLEMGYMMRQIKVLTAEAEALLKTEISIPTVKLSTPQLPESRMTLDQAKAAQASLVSFATNWGYTPEQLKPLKGGTPETLSIEQLIKTPKILEIDESNNGQIYQLEQPYPTNPTKLYETVKPTIVCGPDDTEFQTWKEDFVTKNSREPNRLDVIEYITNKYSKTHYIPDATYAEWLNKNSTHSNATNLKDNNYYYTAATSFGYRTGDVCVPCVCGSGLRPFAAWIRRGWSDGDRVLLLEIPFAPKP